MRQTRPLGDGITTMEDPSSPDGVATTAHARMAPFVALRECLELQTAAPRRSPFARLFGVNPLARGSIRSYRGAIVELLVADALLALGEGWTVLHSVPMGPDVAELEHLVIGPPGALVISTENHAGQKVWVGERTFIADGVRHPYLPIAEHQNRAVAARFAADGHGSVSVASCIVVAGPSELTVSGRMRHIEVLASRDFERWLLDLPRIRSPRFVSALATTASAWPDPTDFEDDTESRLRAFDSLRCRIRRSLVLRLGWIAVGIALSYGALYSGVLVLLSIGA